MIRIMRDNTVSVDVYYGNGTDDYYQNYDLVELVNEKLDMDIDYDFLLSYRNYDIVTKMQLEEMTEKFLSLSPSKRELLIKELDKL